MRFFLEISLSLSLLSFSVSVYGIELCEKFWLKLAKTTPRIKSKNLQKSKIHSSDSSSEKKNSNPIPQKSKMVRHISLSLFLSLTHTYTNTKVVYAAAILSKSGKLLLSRQYADMQRIRVEGLLAAFTKLLADNSSKQHTFVETPQVRYLYHPLENMYVLLVTNKASNIMEDLDTLRMLSKVVRNFFSEFTNHLHM